MAGRIPKLCHHRRSGLAYVTDPHTHREHYLGTWGTPEAEKAYGAWVQQFLARRQQVASGAVPDSGIRIGQLIESYMAFARGYYLKDGKETTEIHAIKQALLPLNNLFGEMEADSFGPAELKAVRERMVSGAAGKRGKPWSRKNINNQIQRIRRVFRWGVEHEQVRPETLERLKAVPGLRKGRSAAMEKEPVTPVDLAVVEATLPRLDPIVRAMAEIQLHADMRPGELVIMRGCDIDRAEIPWLYVPHTHKTEHHDIKRRIWLGPKAREILTPLLLRSPGEEAWLFPSRARGRNYRCRGVTHWTVSGYRKAIREACRATEALPEIPRWHPHQLRHLMATIIRSQHGVEAAQVILGHAKLDVTQLYAEKNEALARDIAEKIG